MTAKGVEKKIRDILRDFKQTKKEELISGLMNDFHKFCIDEGDYDEMRLIRYLFNKFLKFIVWDKPFEKTNWEIPFLYKNILGSFTHQKFGFRIYIDNKIDRDDALTVFNEINKKVEICLKLIKPLIREEGMQSLNNGEVIVENKLNEIEKEFRFFLRESKRKTKRSNVPSSIKLSDQLLRMNFKLHEEGRYLSDAANITFFSLLEHLCILGLAFTTRPERYKLSDFARLTWQDKFKLVFPIQNPEFSIFYNKFIDLAKYRRNPTAHGYLDKMYTIFHFYLPEAKHRIPMGLYSRELFAELRKENNLNIFESFLKLIRKNNETKRWIRYLDAGFDIYYESDSFNEYQQYMKFTEQGAKEYLEHQMRLEDDLGNMDW